MKLQGVATTVACILLASCVTVGPDFKAPEQSPVILQGAAEPVFSKNSPVAIWWGQFDDPVLEKLVRNALANNLDLRVAVSRVSRARALFSLSRLDQAPHVTANGSYYRGNQPDSQQAGEPMLSESYQLGFDASWELDLFGGKRRAIESARADLDAEQANFAYAQVLVAAEVARNYFELRGTQKRISVAQLTLINLQDTQKLTEARRDLGTGSELEVQSSLARLKDIESNIPLLEVAQTQASTRLAVLMGLRPEAVLDTLAPREMPAFAKSLPLGDTRELLRQRPDVRAAERRLAGATARVGVATADLFPRLSLTGFVGFLGGGAGGLVSASNKVWSLTPSLTWAAFDFGTVQARLRASKADADGVAAQYQQTVLIALEDTENALSRYAKQQSRLSIIVERAQAARHAEELARANYSEGQNDFLTVLDAQRTQLAADDALATAESDVNVSVVGVYKALGGWNQSPQPSVVLR